MGLYPPFFLNHSNIRVKPITILMGSQAATRSVLRPVWDRIAFKVSLDQLNDRDTKSYFIATKTETAMDKVITLHNQKVANDNK